MAPIPFPDQLACIDREIARREADYPAAITGGAMTRDDANAEFAAITAARGTLLIAARAAGALADAVGGVWSFDEDAPAPDVDSEKPPAKLSPERERNAQLIRFDRACHEFGLTNDGIRSVVQAAGQTRVDDLAAGHLRNATDHLTECDADDGRRRAMALNADGYQRYAIAAIENAPEGRARLDVHARAVEAAGSRFEGDLLRNVTAALDRAAGVAVEPA